MLVGAEVQILKSSEKNGRSPKKKRRSSVGWLHVLRHFQDNNWTNFAAKRVMTFFFFFGDHLVAKELVTFFYSPFSGHLHLL